MSFTEELRYNYDLNINSLVFDIGGYKGGFANRIFDKYGCKVYVFEPLFSIQNSTGIKVFPFGISDTTRNDYISVDEDSSSLYSDKNKIKIKLMALEDFLTVMNINKVDLIKINIEGEEYRLLNHMINTGIINIFDNIQIQFHSFMPDSEKKRNEIIRKLKNTHICEWCYEFIWESWKKKI